MPPPSDEATPGEATPGEATPGEATPGEAAFQDLTFAEALGRLESLVERLDGSDDDPPALEEALDAYEEGTTLARECMRRLDQAELRVERLSIDE